MRGVILFLVGLVAGTLVMRPIAAQENKTPDNKKTGLSVHVVGINVNDYSASKNFYEKVMGFPIAFQFSSPDGKRTTIYYQISRDSFMEMAQATPDAPAGITHVHLYTDDIAGAVARVRQAAVAPNTEFLFPQVVDARVIQPSLVKSTNVYREGLRIEMNELIPESLTLKAIQAWK